MKPLYLQKLIKAYWIPWLSNVKSDTSNGYQFNNVI